MKGKTWTKLQQFIVALSAVLMGNERLFNFRYKGTLFGLAAPTVSILSIFFSSLLLLALCRNRLAECSLLCDARHRDASWSELLTDFQSVVWEHNLCLPLFTFF